MGLYEQVSGIHVDLDSFDGLAAQLERIRDFLRTELLQTRLEQLAAAERQTGAGGRGTLYGNFDQARDLVGRIGKARGQVRQELSTVQQQVDGLIAATRLIQQSYRTLEERNQADAKQLQVLLDAAPPPGVPGTPGTPVATDPAAAPSAPHA